MKDGAPIGTHFNSLYFDVSPARSHCLRHFLTRPWKCCLSWPLAVLARVVMNAHLVDESFLTAKRCRHVLAVDFEHLPQETQRQTRQQSKACSQQPYRPTDATTGCSICTYKCRCKWAAQPFDCRFSHRNASMTHHAAASTRGLDLVPDRCASSLPGVAYSSAATVSHNSAAYGYLQAHFANKRLLRDLEPGSLGLSSESFCHLHRYRH